MAGTKIKPVWLVRDCSVKDYLKSVFKTRKLAMRVAARAFGYESYSDAKKDGWCEVIKFVPAEPPQ